MRARRRVVVVGGGLGGLSAGWTLARAGHEVVVLERKSALGGRAGSTVDEPSGEPVDTGQHVFLGCYRATMKWFGDLGTAKMIRFQDRLEVPYRREGGARVAFRAAKLPRPFHLLGGLAALPGSSLREKAGLWRLGGALRASSALDGMTVAAWLDRARVPRAARELVLEPLALAALNEAPEVASALPFAVTIRELLLTGNRGCAIGLAATGLGDAYAPAAGAFIELSGGKVLPGAWARALLVDAAGRARGVRLADGKEVEADAVVSTVPPWDLAPLVAGVPPLERLAAAAGTFAPSPIVTVHLWRDPPVGAAPFTGLPGARFDWLFNRTAITGRGRLAAEHLCLVKSGARDLLGTKPEALVAQAEEVLERHLPEARGGSTIHARVVWETKATVSLAPGSDALRPPLLTSVPGFVLAGDWVRTGWPATIESAVRSGLAAARAVVSSFR